jgi:hypothetical protein
MADKRGEALESFVATMLLRRYPAGIRQVNPPRITAVSELAQRTAALAASIASH